MGIEFIEDATGHWWLCIGCGRSGETHRTKDRAQREAAAHQCKPEERTGGVRVGGHEDHDWDATAEAAYYARLGAGRTK